MDCEIPHRFGRRTKYFFYKGVETLPGRRVLKTLSENPKEKAQRGQYLLVVGLSFSFCISTEFIDDVKRVLIDDVNRVLIVF